MVIVHFEVPRECDLTLAYDPDTARNKFVSLAKSRHPSVCLQEIPGLKVPILSGACKGCIYFSVRGAELISQVLGLHEED